MSVNSPFCFPSSRLRNTHTTPLETHYKIDLPSALVLQQFERSQECWAKNYDIVMYLQKKVFYKKDILIFVQGTVLLFSLENVLKGLILNVDKAKMSA